MSCYSSFIPDVKGSFPSDQFIKSNEICTPDKKETKIKITEKSNNNVNLNIVNNANNVNQKMKDLLSSNSSNMENVGLKNNNNVNINTKNQSSNLEKSKDFMYKCNICYIHPGTLILSCYCLYCKGCLGNHIKSNLKNCLMCGDIVNLKVTKDLNKKENYEKYNFIFIEPEKLFQQGLESQKFQARYKDKQIKYLELKVSNQSNNNIMNKNAVLNNSLMANEKSNLNVNINRCTDNSLQVNQISNERKVSNANISVNRPIQLVSENLANPRKISPKITNKDVINTNSSIKGANNKIENLNSRTSKMLSGSTLNNYNSTSKKTNDILNTEINNSNQECIFENKSVNKSISNYKGNISKNTKFEENNQDSKSIKFNKVEINKHQANNYFTTPIGNYGRDFAEYYYK